jgi:thiol-disulfide isomerase/thioredoxin
MIGTPAPGLSVTRWLGLPEATTLADFEGKVVLVSFWGLWCSPCKDALPEIDALARDLKAAGFEVVALHTPTKADQVPAWYRKAAPGFAVGLDDGGSAEAWSVANYPTYFLLGRDGTVRGAFISTPGPGEIEPLLDEPAAP